jgi:hypothetical protein
VVVLLDLPLGAEAGPLDGDYPCLLVHLEALE